MATSGTAFEGPPSQIRYAGGESVGCRRHSRAQPGRDEFYDAVRFLTFTFYLFFAENSSLCL